MDVYMMFVKHYVKGGPSNVLFYVQETQYFM
jgi:hypothetical protein